MGEMKIAGKIDNKRNTQKCAPLQLGRPKEQNLSYRFSLFFGSVIVKLSQNVTHLWPSPTYDLVICDFFSRLLRWCVACRVTYFQVESLETSYDVTILVCLLR